MNPENPEVKGIGEVEHDGMPHAGHDEQADRAGKGDKEPDNDSDDK